jgi:predicted amidohydrolase/GNAT superfamily N-acetyltransferase
MDTIENIELSFLTLDDYQQLKEATLASYTQMPNAFWGREYLQSLIERFPEGQVVIKVNQQIAGGALSIIVDYESFDEHHTYREITGNYTFDTHTPDGDVLYGIDIFIKPEFRGLRLGRRLYNYRKDLAERLNLRGVAFGGRIPEYHKYADTLTPKEYINKVKQKEIYDPVLNFQLSNDFHVAKVLKNYLEGDKESNEYAVLLEWDNIYYIKKRKVAAVQKKVVRLGLVQWQMRHYKNLDELLSQVEYFVDAVSAYRSDFALFPELFNAPLMADNNHLSPPEALRELASHTPDILRRFCELAIAYNINIITGSMPEMIDDRPYNVGYLCRRDGTTERYEKLHITPAERRVFGWEKGEQLKVFDTDCGKIGVLICYDVEFPELSRLLALDGMEILFVPFLTDTQDGYSRVRNCARARAIENECYVAIAGSVGNLPKVHNMDTRYAQSMVLTPCDFSFPPNGIKAQATPNTEMILVADVDLHLLHELHLFGTVRNLEDRRTDIFELKHIRKD